MMILMKLIVSILREPLASIGEDASQLEDAAKNLSFEAVGALVVIAGLKNASFVAAYEIMEEGVVKDELLESIIPFEVNKTLR